MKRTRGRVVELERTKARALSVEVEAPPEGPPPEVITSPMYGVAMLKIAMELKRAPAAALDDIVRGVLQRMRLDESSFRRFLEQNGGLLRAIAQRKAL